MLTLEGGGPNGPGRSRRHRLRRRRPWPRLRLPRVPAGAFDLAAVLALLVLAGLGILNLYAVGGLPLADHQAVVVLAGVAGLVVFWRIRARLLTLLGWACYGVAVVALAAVLVVGSEANGAQRWIALSGFTFQPSELAKLGLLIVLAGVAGSNRPDWQRFLFSLVLAAIPIGLTVLEPDLSTATLLVVLTATMMILGRIPARFLVPLFGGALVIAPLAVGLLRPYQIDRLTAFLAATPANSGTGWAVYQAHIALASGGLLGQAGNPMRQLLAEYLPERETDLALASLAEQWGLVAAAAAVAAALVLVWRLAVAARVPRERAGGLVAAGLAVLIGVEAAVSLGGNLGLLPVAGVPFPLVSYGGTAVFVHLVALGIVLAVRRDGARRRLWSAPSWRHARPRLGRFAALALTCLLLVFAGYAWNLQNTQGAALRLAGQSQMTRCITLPAPRGTITDRHGTPLATGVDTQTVLAVPALLRGRPADVDRLAALTGQPADAVQHTLDTLPATTLSTPLADVPPATAGQIAAAGLPGVVLVPKPARRYPEGALLGPMLGFAGIATPTELRRWPGLSPTAIVGRAGLEQSYDAVLRGVDGQDCFTVDPVGEPVAQSTIRAPVPGADLRLSLDLPLQRYLTSTLAGALATEPHGAVGGAVAMDPRTGAVLAMASLPSFDNNAYGPPVDSAALQAAARAPGQPTLEHVTQLAAPPGSTFKLVVAAADLRAPPWDPGAVIPTGGSFTLGGHTFNNWRVLPPQNLVQAIAWSNDVYFYKLAAALGPDALTGTAGEFGVGQPTGIDLPGESAGYLGTPQSVTQAGGTWYGGSTVILGIGQGYLTVTPLQNARWTAAAATGNLVTPRLGMATGSGTYTALPAPRTTPLPFAGLLGPVREGMRAAVTSGTATQLNSLPVPVGAKTGTAQDPSAGGSGLDDWMTAAAPFDSPSIVVTAMVQGHGDGASRTGPVVRQALDYYFAHQQDILATPPVQQVAGG
ncbi:FtsW/RodA/SpoVE family cell cycle protein [Amycolatopsis thermophila]|uniref:Cell division protein FtsI/penicillin-binding protein 2/cell division protein FtsW (Lipid II flippase) n=1 Tax=Amycolatopsis thermophila TaxID=206084 RepID=A0ABU0EYT8_9PSEU|nr:FtsW/RodA/SpoVE family cell cycle protein [Amycolatopsis thermophila]MDQ0380478.1 cell division protein FtsI/penicillin-binding protein 2/cell division protein FtsW (lipid II flippase) [Amycolatopsis thermophila]